MKTIMVDMDNVITDGSFKKHIEEFFDISFELDDLTEYAYVQKMTQADAKGFWNYVKNKNFYKDAPLLDGCFEVLKKLNEKYDVYIVTSYLWNETIDISGNNLSNKYYYLQKMLPFIKPDKYIFTTNKDLLNFDIRIDDRINNLNGATTKLLFTAWHNRSIPTNELKEKNIVRVNNWKDIEKVLLNNNL